MHRSVSASRFMIHAEAVTRAVDQRGAVHGGDIVVCKDEAVDELDA